MTRRFPLAIAGALLLAAGASVAQTFSVKGVLRDPLGKTVEDGSYRLTFRLYSAAVDGTQLWSEEQTSVPTQHGVFSAELGTVNSLDVVAFNKEMWLGISVEDNAELAPRIKIGRTPYSISLLGVSNIVPSSGGAGFGTLTPQSAVDVEGGAAIGAAYAGDTAAPANGLIVEGAVGIGTPTPSEPLEVSGNAKVTGALIFGDGTSISTAELSGSASSVTNPTSALITADSDADGSGQIEFKTGASTDMVVANNGNIGIGLPDPGWPLHTRVNASGRPQAMAIENASGNVGDGASLIFLANNGSNGTGGIGSVITSTSPFNADVRISAINGGNWVPDVLTVGHEGRVGIGSGATLPLDKLHVDGGIRAESTITTPGHFTTTGTGRMETYMMIARRSGGNGAAPDIEGVGGLVLSGGGGRVQVADGQHMYAANNYGFFALGSGGGLGSGIDSDASDNLDLWAGGAARARVGADGTLQTLDGNISTGGNGSMYTYHLVTRRSGGNHAFPDIEGTAGLVLSGGGGGAVKVTGDTHVMRGFEGVTVNGSNRTDDTDVIVVGYCSSSAQSHARAWGYVNDGLVAFEEARDNDYGTTVSITFPVPAGMPWRVEGHGSCTFRYIPFGH